MSVIGSNILAGASGQGGGYNLTRSLRFRRSASAYLNRTPASAGNRQKFTYSLWVKRGALESATSYFFHSSGANTTSDRSEFMFNGDNNVMLGVNISGTWYEPYTVAVFRDPSAWYHIVATVDTTQATDSNRIKIYVNGVQQTLAGTFPPQNSNTSVNNTVVQGIGYYSPANSGYYDGYMAEFNFIDGQALTPSSFGETSTTTGVWQPKKYAGTYGTNGFYLPFTDNSALTTSSNVGLGKDFSGNGNYWTTNNISITSGATYDSMTDVPTLTSATASNFATLNPTIRPYPSADIILNANLRVTNTVGSNISGSAWGTIPVTSGKWYAECIVTTVGNWSGSSDYIGISNNAVTAGLGTYNGPLRDAGYTYVSNGQKAVNGSSSAYGATYTTGDVIGIALDADSNSITFYKNGTSQGVAFTSMTNTGGYLFGSTLSNNGVHDWNFGQRPFAYTPPTGFVALNTFNLPTPTIGATASTQANKYFDIVLRNGFGSSGGSITSLQFQPDFWWEKARSGAASNNLEDSVRGVTKILISNSTAAESTDTTYLTSFNSNGFTMGTGDYGTSTTLVDWCWKAGGAGGVTNTAGSITSTVSANTSSGFSVVTFTSPASGTCSVGHGLGVKPSMVIVKCRSVGNSGWFVWHQALGDNNTDYLMLHSTAAEQSYSTMWGTVGRTSTLLGFTQGGTLEANATHVAYAFSEVAGYSKFGSYTGNGSSDGTFVYTGFKPRFVLVKRTDTTANWILIDTARDTYNASGLELFPNLSNAENDNRPELDVLSNGFKLRWTYTGTNASGGNYVYACFAEHPFKYSLGK